MGLQCGIVGLPNVGKSTLFNAITQAGIEAANYPFCTIEPNVGVVAIPDPRLQQLADIVHPEKILNNTMEFVDIAGLVKGASKGEGLGNQFLANIRECDAICHVVRCFENDDITHVHGKIDPLADIEIIEMELLLADADTVEKSLQKANKNAKSGNKAQIAEKAILENLLAHLNQGRAARSFECDDEEHMPQLLKYKHLLTQKPIMYIANVSEQKDADNEQVQRVQEHAAKEKAIVVPLCAAIESEIAELDDEEKQAFLDDLGLTEPGLDRVIKAGFELLGLQTYFTAGVKEVRAWSVKTGASAPEAAGVIHTDFEKGFIRAEVIGFDDYIKYKGETGAKEAGVWRLEGKNYVVQEGDVMHFRFNV